MPGELLGKAPALASGRRARRSTVDEGVSYYRRHPQAAPLVVGARTWELLRWKEEIEPVPASYRTPLAAERRRRSGASPDCPQKLGLSDLEPRKVSCFAEEKYIFPVGRKTEIGFRRLRDDKIIGFLCAAARGCWRRRPVRHSGRRREPLRR